MEIFTAIFAIGIFFAFLSFLMIVLKIALWMTIFYTAWRLFEILILKE